MGEDKLDLNSSKHLSKESKELFKAHVVSFIESQSEQAVLRSTSAFITLKLTPDGCIDVFAFNQNLESLAKSLEPNYDERNKRENENEDRRYKRLTFFVKEAFTDPILRFLKNQMN